MHKLLQSLPKNDNSLIEKYGCPEGSVEVRKYFLFLKKGKIEHPVKVFCCTLLFPVLATHTYELEETQEGLIAQCCVVFNLKVHFGACCVDA